MLTIRGRLITPFVLGSMSVGLNILIRHSFMDLWVWITALVPWPQLLWTCASIPSWNCLTIAMNLVGQPNFAIISQRSYIYKLKSCWLEIKNGHHSCNFENRFLTSAPEPFGHLRWKLHFSNRMTCRSKVYKNSAAQTSKTAATTAILKTNFWHPLNRWAIWIETY